jgi:hypothetical protein
VSDIIQLIGVTVAAALGSTINAIAGGGTLITFPSLIAFGVSPIVANATSTVALWPGALGSMLGYRHLLRGARAWAVEFAVPSLLGGFAGALLLLWTPAERFAHLAPWLVFGATCLFALQGALARRVRQAAAVPGGEHAVEANLGRPPVKHLFAQFFVGVYGGYFGAGIGILMLAILGMMGLRNIHQMNGLKNWGGLCINFVAAVTFALSGLVDWFVAICMAVGATAGGYAASRLAQRVPQMWVRRAVLLVGFGSGLWLLRAG